MKRIYFDTEFTTFENPQLISLGMAAGNDEEFYCEFNDTWLESDCSEFVLDTVLPELEGGAVAMPEAECVRQLVAWINGFAEPVQLACDSHYYDKPLIEALFGKYGWPDNLDREVVWIDVDDSKFYVALDALIDEYPEAIRHHALWDARLLMMADQLKSKLTFLADREG